MKIARIILYLTYALIVIAFLGAVGLFASGLLSFTASLLVIVVSIGMNLFAYFFYRRLCLMHAALSGISREKALLDFEKEFPSYRDS